MNTHNLTQINSILNQIKIDHLALKTGFTKRRNSKITPSAFLLSFYSMILCGQVGLRNWAFHLSIIIQQKISFQALALRMSFRSLPFFQALLTKVIQLKMYHIYGREVQDLLKPFNRVLLEDSTCFKLSKHLFPFFPGPRMPFGRVASGRIQLRFCIKTNTYQQVLLQSYCDVDQAFSSNVLSVMNKGDLLIRDLGYSSIQVFKNIISLNAFFLSRFSLKYNVYDPKTLETVDLMKYLKKCEINGQTMVDTNFLVTQKEKLLTRFIAIKLTPENAKKRRKMAISNKHKEHKIKAKDNYLLGWNIFITNIPYETMETKQIYEAYSLRWHIEMIFKNWKSKINLESYFKNCVSPNPAKPEIKFYLLLTWIIIVYQPKYNYYAKKVYEKFRKVVSPIKFIDFLKTTKVNRINKLTEGKIIELLGYYYCYDIRKDRKNHFEKTYMNYFT